MENKRFVAVVVFLIVVLACGTITAESIKPRGQAPEAAEAPSDQARDLYYASDTAGQSRHPGVRVKVYQAMEDCDFAQVSSRKAFGAGDKVRFGVETNSNGYLYVIQRGTSGTSTLLYPHKDIDGNRNNVTRARELVIPAKKWFTFDRTPGTESLLFVLSRKPLDIIPYLVPAVGGDEGKPPSGSVESDVLAMLQGRGAAKDLVLSPEAPVPTQTGSATIYDSTYSVNPSNSDYTMLRVDLNHR